jgi:carbonic anhydrase
MRKIYIIIAFALFYCGIHAAQPTPMQALSMLMEGNRHFVSNQMTHLSYLKEAKSRLLEQQTPFAVIVGCSDSRVPPEVIFDRGLGELFVVRVAGNVLGPIELDSINFAVQHLKVPIVMVLGHQNCGAVDASLKGKENVPEFLDAIYPLIEEALKNCATNGPNPLADAISCNVKNGVNILKTSAALAPLIEEKKVKIIGGYFEFDTGKVNLISD